MTDFALTITASPFDTDQHNRAQRFMAAAIDGEHHVTQVFFYQEAVLAALPNTTVYSAWVELAQKAKCPLYVCVSAAERRGIVESAAPFEIVGLGDWVEGLSVDKHLQFGV